MENQERSIEEVTSILMDAVKKAKLQSFSILSSKGEKTSAVCGVIAGEPIEIISSLVMMMSQNKQVYNIVKTAVDAFEKLPELRSFTPRTNQKAGMEEFLKNLFMTIHNG